MFKKIGIILSIICIIIISSCTTSSVTNKYTVTFKDYNDIVLKKQIIEEGSNAIAPEVPSRYGYEFIGWDKDYKNVKENLLVVAQYKELDKYIVSFNSNSNILIEPIEVYKGYNISKPIDPSKEGYEFSGWYLNNVIYDFESPVMDNLLLEAKWVLYSEEHNLEITQKDPTCINDGYILYSCTDCDYEKIETLYSEGHSVSYIEETLEPTCTEDGYQKGVCDKCNEIITITLSATGHIEGEQHLTDEYCGEHKIGYVNCEKCNELIYEYGHSYSEIKIDPTCEEDGIITYSCIHCNYSYEKIIKSPGHISGEWIIEKEPTCTKEGLETLSCIICNELIKSSEIKKIEHTYTSTIETDKIIYNCLHCSDSYFIDIAEYHNITFISNGGTEYAPLMVTESSDINLPIPIKDEYEFAGWYLDDELENLFTKDYIIKEDITLYAGWYQPTIKGKINSNNIIRNVKKDFSFVVTTDILLTNDNINEYIFVEDVDGNKPKIYIKEQINNEYTITSDEYKNSLKYSVNIIEPLEFKDSDGYEIWFIVEDENHTNIKYKSNVKFLNSLEIYSVTEDEKNIYISLREDLYNVNDIVVVYEDTIDNVTFIMMIVSEVQSGLQTIYKITSPDLSLVFEEYDVYYSGELEIDDVEFNENLEEELTEELMNSTLYKQFEETSKKFAKRYATNDYKYVYKGITFKPNLTKNKTSIIVSIPVVAKFERIHKSTNTVDSEFTISLKINLTTSLNASLKGGITSFAFAVDVNTSLTVDLVASANRSYSDKYELSFFKELYLDEKENGEFKEIDSATANASNKKSFGKVKINMPAGFSINFELANVVNFSAVGEIGVKAKVTTKTSLGLSYKSGDGIKPIKSFSSDASIDAYMMGRIEVENGFTFKLSLGFLGVVNVYAEASAIPYFEVGGMVMASARKGSGSNVIANGYLEIGVNINVKVGANAKLEIKIWTFWKTYKITTTLFDKSWNLLSTKVKIVSLGKKEAALYFSEKSESVSQDINCNSTLDIDKLIDKTIIVQDLTKLSKSNKTTSCTYYLAEYNPNIKISTKGIITILNLKDDTITIKIKAISGDIYKYVYVTLNIKHTEKYVEQIDPTCTQDGNNAYSICTKCSYITSGSNTTIAKLGHDEIYHNDKAATCTEEGYKNYITCSRCDYETKTIVEKLGHIEVIDEGYEATCLKEGLTDGSHCSRCNVILKEQKIIDTSIHIYVDEYCKWCTKYEQESEGLEYLLVEGGYQVIGIGTCLDTDLIIPKTYDNLPVISIKRNCFAMCTNIISIQFSKDSQLIDIGDFAFSHCSNLQSIEIPNSVENVGSYTFWNTDLKNINFEENSKLISIGDYAFYNCVKLCSIEIPNSVINIGHYAFANSGIQSINLSKNIENLGVAPFIDCSKLINIFVDQENRNYKSIDGNLYSKDGKELIQYAIAKQESFFIVSKNVTKIGDYSFAGCQNLKSVQLSEGIIDIGMNAFSYCNKLENIILSKNLISINKEAFKNCTSLKNIIIPKSVINIGENVFKSCENLIIYCELECKPNTWSNNWNPEGIQVNWNYKEIYTIQFKNYDGTILKEENVEAGNDATAPTPPVREGYNFIGWDKGYNDIMDNLEIIAQYECIIYTLTFHSNGGNNIDDLKFTIEMNNIELPTPIREGYDFLGWYEENILVLNFSLKDYYLVAKWKKIEEEVKIEIYEENKYKYLNFGRYPQTVLSDTSTINILSTITTTNEYGYIEYNGNEYLRVNADPLGSNYTFNNGNLIIKDNIYYFIVEPIKWRIIEENNNTYKLFSEYIVDNMMFFIRGSNRIIDEKTIYPNNYEYSDIRAWLNGYDGSKYNVKNYKNIGFIDIAFTTMEQNIISSVIVDNSLTSNIETNKDFLCSNTTDKIYLLSFADILNSKYGFSNDYNDLDVLRRSVTSDYVRCKYCSMSTKTNYYGNGYWWLRSSDNSDYNSVKGIFSDGYGYGFYTSDKFVGVRPAMTITIK